MATHFACTVDLPESFRPGDILAFHRRDAQAIAERVTGASLRKGMVWHGVAACLSVDFLPGRARATLAFDGQVDDASRPTFERMVRRMLGVTQRIEDFENRYRSHPQIGVLIARQPGLRVPVAATPFEALTWAVTGQQISVGAAVSLRRKLIVAANMRHSSGLLCYPEARQVAALDQESLRLAGFSMAKSRTLLTLAELIVDNALPLDLWTQTLPIDAIWERLAAVRGIGPWTINYALLRGFGWLDGSLHGDVAVRRGVQDLLGLPEKIGEEQAKVWLAEFSPWRALVAAHLWAARSLSA